MKPLMILGIVLIILGAIGLAVQGITYTTREKVVDIGVLQVTADTQKTIPIPLIAGGLALAGGIAVVVVAARRRAPRQALRPLGRKDAGRPPEGRPPGKINER